jgi:hypothetical protein
MSRFVIFVKKLYKNDSAAFIALGVFVFCSLITFVWFDGDFLLGVGDSYRAMDRYRFLRTVNSGWRGEQNTGNYEYFTEYHFPASLLYFPLTFLGFSNLAISKLWIALSVVLPAFFTFLFVRRFWGKDTHWLICTATALFYVFNPISLVHQYGVGLTRYPVYLALPLMCYLIVCVFEEKNWSTKMLLGIYLSLSTILMAGSFGNVAELAPAFFVLPLLILFELFTHKDRLKYLALLIGVASLAFFINFWWISSSFLNRYLIRSEFTKSVEKWGGWGSKVFDALRLFGFWALMSNNEGLPYFFYGERYYVNLGVTASYLVTVIAFLSIFIQTVKKKVDKRVLLFVFFALVGVFLVKGPNPPVGKWYVTLYEKYPLFRMFREPFAKFSLITLFSFVVLVGYSLTYLAQVSRKKLSKYSYVVISGIFLLVLLYIVYPMLKRDWINVHTYGPMKQFRVKVPEYWFELEEYSKKENIQSRIFTTPKTWYFRKSFIWESGFVGNPLELYLHGTWINHRWADPKTKGDLLIEQLYGFLERYNTEQSEEPLSQYLNLSRLLGVGYVLQMNDFDWLSFGDDYVFWSVYKMADFFNTLEPYYSLERSFGVFTPDRIKAIPHIMGGENIYRKKDGPTTQDYLSSLIGRTALDMYKVKDDYVLDKIYIPDWIEGVDSMETMLVRLQDLSYLARKPLFISTENPVSAKLFEDTFLDEISDAQLQSERLTEARYRVSITSFPGVNLPLVFGETYSKGWRLAKHCNWLFCSGSLDTEHFVANFYGNGWLLPNVPNGTTFYIYHEADTRFRLGLAISAVSILVAVVGAAILVRKNRKKKR